MNVGYTHKIAESSITHGDFTHRKQSKLSTPCNYLFIYPAILWCFYKHPSQTLKIIIALNRAQYSAQNEGVNSRWYACRGGWLLVYNMYLPQPRMEWRIIWNHDSWLWYRWRFISFGDQYLQVNLCLHWVI